MARGTLSEFADRRAIELAWSACIYRRPGGGARPDESRGRHRQYCRLRVRRGTTRRWLRPGGVDRDVRAHEELWPLAREDCALDARRREAVRAHLRASHAGLSLPRAGWQRLDVE